MTEVPFPDAPSYGEIREMEPDSGEEAFEMGASGEIFEKGSWYTEAVYTAANLIVEVANEYPEFREEFLENDGFGAAFAMRDYDSEAYRKLNRMSLSANQGGTAENAARHYLEDNNG